MNSERLPALADVGDQVLAAKLETLIGGGGLEDLASIDEGARLSEDPWMLDGSPSDHDSGAAGLLDGTHGVLSGPHVPVDQNGNTYDFARSRRP
jgi:hypothetical protein